MQMLSRINETSDFDRLDETIKYEWKREFCIEKKNEKRFEFKVWMCNILIIGYA